MSFVRGLGWEGCMRCMILTKQEAIKARNQELAAEVSAMEAKLEDARGKLKYVPHLPYPQPYPQSCHIIYSQQLSPAQQLTTAKEPRCCGDGEGAYQASACV